jgi:hypothetical protein
MYSSAPRQGQLGPLQAPTSTRSVTHRRENISHYRTPVSNDSPPNACDHFETHTPTVPVTTSCYKHFRTSTFYRNFSLWILQECIRKAKELQILLTFYPQLPLSSLFVTHTMHTLNNQYINLEMHLIKYINKINTK